MSNKLEIIYINHSQLHLLENNPRRIKDPGAIEKLKILIKEHSFQNPLQVYQEKDGSYSILCGNHRFMAAKELGYTEFPCIVYTGDRKRALARAISDNKSSEWTEYDYPKLADMFIEIDTGDFELPDLTGFDTSETEEIITRETELKAVEEWNIEKTHTPFWVVIRGSVENYNKILPILSQIEKFEDVVVETSQNGKTPK